MEATLGLSQKTTQSLVLTQQMEQSIKILELDTFELNDYIQNAALENPAIDVDALSQGNAAELRRKKLEWLEEQARYDKKYVGYYDPDTDFSLEKVVASPADLSLTEHLREQATLVCKESELPVLEYLIELLDEDGYMRADIAEVAQDTQYTEKQMEDGYKILRSLEPAGVGARDLADCLLLQLPPDATLERTIVSDYLDLLAKNRCDRLAKTLLVDIERIHKAFERIKSLNPRPGAGFSPPELPHYVTPDVVVTHFQNHYHVMPCEFSYPTVRVSSSILELAHTSNDKDVLSYVDQKIKQVQWIQRCISTRTDTILSVARIIVQKQERFFRYGPQYLNMLRMSDVASILEIHESTVSRAVRNKYLQCHHGTFPLRYFFVQGLKSTNGTDDVSSHTIKHTIREMIRNENKSSPLSDQKIADILSGQGTAISRRTVAKYRDQMGIPNSSSR